MNKERKLKRIQIKTTVLQIQEPYTNVYTWNIFRHGLASAWCAFVKNLHLGHEAGAEARLGRRGCLVAVVAHEGGPDVGLTAAQHQSPQKAYHKMITSDGHI